MATTEDAKILAVVTSVPELAGDEALIQSLAGASAEAWEERPPID